VQLCKDVTWRSFAIVPCTNYCADLNNYWWLSNNPSIFVVELLASMDANTIDYGSIFTSTSLILHFKKCSLDCKIYNGEITETLSKGRQ